MAGYGADEEFGAWLTANGFSLPATAPAPAILRQRGSDYVDGTYGGSLPGEPAGGIDQERAWPRIGATAFRKPIADDAIPLRWVHASYHAAYHEALNPGSLLVSGTAAGAVKREKVDTLEVEYFAGSGSVAADATVRISAVEGLVAPFLIQGSVDGPAIWSIG